jgi:hypothetical protein
MHEREAPTPPEVPLSGSLTPLLNEAVKKAEDAAERAEKAAVRPRYWLIAGFLFAFVGAVLSFALEESDSSVLGVSLQPLGGVLFAAGALTIAGAGIASVGSANGGPSAEGIKSVGGLIAVVVGITAVTALTIVTLTKLGEENKDSMVAVTSSAFGIISAVVGAYLGIKITADTNKKASDEAKSAGAAENEAKHAHHRADALKQAATEKFGEEAARDLEYHAGRNMEEAAGRAGPPKGGGPA